MLEQFNAKYLVELPPLYGGACLTIHDDHQNSIVDIYLSLKQFQEKLLLKPR